VQHRERYERFRTRFCSREDGHATERVLALVEPSAAGARQSA
jgi:hypothetical protein